MSRSLGDHLEKGSAQLCLFCELLSDGVEMRWTQHLARRHVAIAADVVDQQPRLAAVWHVGAQFESMAGKKLQQCGGLVADEPHRRRIELKPDDFYAKVAGPPEQIRGAFEDAKLVTLAVRPSSTGWRVERE